MRILLLAFYILCTYGVVLPDTFNFLIKDVVYKVDMVINEDDYEMIDEKQLNQFKVEGQKFIEFDSIARVEYSNGTRDFLRKNLLRNDPEALYIIPIIVVSTNNDVKATYIGTTHSITRGNKKREIVNESEIEYEYNYNDLIQEYYDQSSNESFVETSEIQDYGILNSLKTIFLTQRGKTYCNESIGLQAIQRLLEDYKIQRRPTKDIVARFWQIARIWFLVYLVVAVPLWCTRGWCCCCLCCKFFKPRETIEEAKKYLISNPPGVFQTKSGVVHYEPTEREKETYEEFEHFIKTL